MLTEKQQKAVFEAYVQTGISLARLAYTPEIQAMADVAFKVDNTSEVTQEDVWKFFHKGGIVRPKIDGKTVAKRVPLTVENAEIIATELKPYINIAEAHVYTREFRIFCDLHPERSRNEWAYDLIRYRKAQYQHVKSVKTDKIETLGAPNAVLSLGQDGMKLDILPGTLLNTPAGSPTRTEVAYVDPPYAGAIVAVDKVNQLYIGPSPLPRTCTLLGQVSDVEARKLQIENQTDRLAKFWYRTTPDYVEYLRDNLSIAESVG